MEDITKYLKMADYFKEIDKRMLKGCVIRCSLSLVTYGLSIVFLMENKIIIGILLLLFCILNIAQLLQKIDMFIDSQTLTMDFMQRNTNYWIDELVKTTLNIKR